VAGIRKGNNGVPKKDEYNEKISYTIAGEWIILYIFIKNSPLCSSKLNVGAGMILAT